MCWAMISSHRARVAEEAVQSPMVMAQMRQLPARNGFSAALKRAEKYEDRL
jgi:hypothetical protein